MVSQYSVALKHLSDSTAKTAPQIIDFMIAILDKRVDIEHDDLNETVTLCLELLDDNWSTSKLWSRLLHSCCSLIFHYTCLDSSLSSYTKAWNQFTKWSQSRLGMFHQPAKCFLDWFKSKSCDDPRLEASLPILVDLLLYGPHYGGNTLDQRHGSMIALKCNAETDAIQDIQG